MRITATIVDLDSFEFTPKADAQNPNPKALAIHQIFIANVNPRQAAHEVRCDAETFGTLAIGQRITFPARIAASVTSNGQAKAVFHVAGSLVVEG